MRIITSYLTQLAMSYMCVYIGIINVPVFIPLRLHKVFPTMAEYEDDIDAQVVVQSNSSQ